MVCLARFIAWTWIALWAIGPSSALACMIYVPPRDEDILQADIVFSGNLIRYERVSENVGMLRIKVNNVLKGVVQGTVDVFWWSPTSDVPPYMNRADPFIVAANRADQPPLSRRHNGPTGDVRKNSYLHVIHRVCSSPLFFDQSSENVAAIENGAERICCQF